MSPKSQSSGDATCCGVIEQAAEAAREKRQTRTKPQPWIVRKLMVGIVFGIMGYAAYVYIQQLCLPMIRKTANALASRGTGIVLLVVFSILYLWMVWAYIVVVMTPPGYARDYIPKSDRPLIPVSTPLRDSWQSTAPSYEPNATRTSSQALDLEMGPRNSSHHARNLSISANTSQTHGSAHVPPQRRDNGLAGPSYEDLLKRDGQQYLPGQEMDAGPMDAIAVPKSALTTTKALTTDGPPPQMSPVVDSSPSLKPQERRNSRPAFRLRLKKPKPIAHAAAPKTPLKDVGRECGQELVNITRRPPMTAVLHPVHRYCTTDMLVKPYRAHHCRICGTCVLKYDHHCPWIGQCVGARNHKFFLNFCQATAVFTSYTLGSLVAYTVMSSNLPTGDINPQEIVIIALAGLFLLFTALLAASHTVLILSGQSTVESMQIRAMKDREADTLARGFRCWEFSAKRRKLEEWDQEWGRLNKEGYIWWKGSAYEEWVDVMGRNWVGWILPIGKSGGDGLDYPVNPRFDPEGRWRRRSEWPEELR